MALSKYSFLMILLLPFLGVSQNITQTIKGKVIEKDSHYPLIGATVILLSDSSKLNGTTTDVEGNFRIERVPVGRHKFKVTFVLSRYPLSFNLGMELFKNFTFRSITNLAYTKNTLHVNIGAPGGQDRANVVHRLDPTRAWSVNHRCHIERPALLDL